MASANIPAPGPSSWAKEYCAASGRSRIHAKKKEQKEVKSKRGGREEGRRKERESGRGLGAPDARDAPATAHLQAAEAAELWVPGGQILDRMCPWRERGRMWTRGVQAHSSSRCRKTGGQGVIHPETHTHLQLLQTLQRTHQSPFWRHSTKPPLPRAAPGTDHTCTQTRPELSATSLWAWRGRQQLGAPVTTAPNRADGKWAHGHSPPHTPATNPDPGGTEKTNPSSPRVWPGRCGVLPATDCSCVGNCAHV